MLHIGEMLPRAGCDQKLAFAGKSSLETNINMKKQSKTNWDRIDSLKDGEIDYSDNPRLDADFFARAVRWPGNKELISLRLDPDVLAFLRSQGKRYQTTINTLLRNYMEAQTAFTNSPKNDSAKRQAPERPRKKKTN